MAPSKLPPCKVCNKKDAGKYRCPLDHVDYCSVVCFKQHKEKSCRSESTYVPPPLPLLAPTNERDDDDKEDDRPRKRLRDLVWPAEPNPILWEDPLQRDDVKPLRPFEYEAIATSPPLRSLLASTSLRNTLTRLTTQLPRHLREASIRNLLSLPLTDQLPNQQYRPDPSKKFSTGLVTKEEERQQQQFQHSPNYRGRVNGRGRGGRGGNNNRGGGGTRLLESTPEERKEIEKFAEEVRKILHEVRERKG
ncbi:hypothetical protein JCM5350_005520 [Sporobolomyces pararoseus]